MTRIPASDDNAEDPQVTARRRAEANGQPPPEQIPGNDRADTWAVLALLPRKGVTLSHVAVLEALRTWSAGPDGIREVEQVRLAKAARGVPVDAQAGPPRPGRVGRDLAQARPGPGHQHPVPDQAGPARDRARAWTASLPSGCPARPEKGSAFVTPFRRPRKRGHGPP